jgi:hypothetical protein
MDCARYIRRETLVSIAINTTLSLVFFAAVFGFGGGAGMGRAICFRFRAASFMIGLMSMLVPGILAGRALGKVAPYRGRPMLPVRSPRARWWWPWPAPRWAWCWRVWR